MVVRIIQCVIVVLALCFVVRVSKAGQCRSMECQDGVACDLPFEDYACGSDVVEAVITILKTHCDIFCHDHQFLRRLAFVETRDGKDNIIVENGGIWGLHKEKLDELRSFFENETVWTNVSKCIADVLRGETAVPDVIFLSKPIASGLVAALYLYYLKINGTASIPLAGNIEEQAQFWKTYYHSGTLTKHDFIQRVYILEREGT